MTATTIRQPNRLNDVGEVWCPGCQQWRVPADFRPDKSRACGYDGFCRPCKAAKDKASRARNPRDRRKHHVPAGDGISGVRTAVADRHGARRLAEPWPADDPAVCVHPGVAVWAEEAADFLRECVAAELCMGIVRGYVATVGQNATGLVHPRFARIESAQVWNAVMKHRTGRRA